MTARRLGEVALVDVRSPINQAGVIFYETLFDENAVCHIAFGEAYPEGVVDGAAMSDEEQRAIGINKADTHVDFMIGTPTMDVDGVTADDRTIPIMRAGRFVADVA
ncbi:MAG: aminopeptidase [Caldilineaceae bacterium]